VFCFSSSIFLDVSLNAAIIKSSSISTSSADTISGRIDNLVICLFPFISTVTIPPPEVEEKILSLWPGPLTIIVPLKEDSSKTIALRCPNDEWLRKIIELTGFSIYSTSVNYSGKEILSDIFDIVDEFESKVSLIVDDGNKKDLKASTIISIINGKKTLIRQGELKIDLSK